MFLFAFQTFAEKSNFLFLHSSNISSIGLIQSKINTCQETFKVVCESMPGIGLKANSGMESLYPIF